ncbi:polyribonucleotide nucleotidyltransferase 1, mitochondrial isoform X2 [Linepithema humile]|nr:PREDICTED: polyribonucleotide nucleotidyltransferase 1, mitochondrial isoform X2 [Linepithema humile]
MSAASQTHLGTEIVTLSDGKQLSLSTGKYARFADGSAIVSLGDTSVMVTAVCKDQLSSNSSFLPLIVDYRQKAAAAARIPTNFLRRELGPTEHEILTSRVIDRSIRPLFPENFYFDTHIMCNMLAIDSANDPDVIAINAASAALSVSNIPWNGPVGAVRIGMIDNDIIIYPTRRQLQNSILNLIITATKNNLIVMMEGSANEILDQDLRKAIKLGVKECQSIVASITNLQKTCGKTKRKIETDRQQDVSLINSVKELSEAKLQDIFSDYTHDKISRDNAVKDLRNNVIKTLQDDNADLDVRSAENIFGKIIKDVFRTLILEKDVRCDGRLLNGLRDISCQVNLFNPLHGSAVFQRGQTQVMCTVTLDSLESALKMDPISMLISGVKEKNFFLHYEFPPYATNEIGSTGRLGRREIGHGALAEKALRPVLPKDYPFTIRLTSQVLESNGSSSMATVCGGSLALLDAGIPVSSPVAGVAMGLVTKYNTTNTNIEEYKILTDILGIEDYLGDMDFKIAATKRGFTALQADVKIPGVPIKIIMECIHQSFSAKSEIFKIMNQTIQTIPKMKKDKMPVVDNLEISVYQRGKFLGVGGMNLKKIFLETGVHIYPHDENTYSIFAPNKDAMTQAKEMIEKILQKDREPTLEFGAIYTAKIMEIRETGVMVTLYSNMMPVLLPNSQLDQRKIHHPSALGLEIGQEIQVKYFGRDPVSGQIRISRKVLQEPITISRTLHRDNTETT